MKKFTHSTLARTASVGVHETKSLYGIRMVSTRLQIHVSGLQSVVARMEEDPAQASAFERPRPIGQTAHAPVVASCRMFARGLSRELSGASGQLSPRLRFCNSRRLAACRSRYYAGAIPIRIIELITATKWR